MEEMGRLLRCEAALCECVWWHIVCVCVCVCVVRGRREGDGTDESWAVLLVLHMWQGVRF